MARVNNPSSPPRWIDRLSAETNIVLTSHLLPSRTPSSESSNPNNYISMDQENDLNSVASSRRFSEPSASKPELAIGVETTGHSNESQSRIKSNSLADILTSSVIRARKSLPPSVVGGSSDVSILSHQAVAPPESIYRRSMYSQAMGVGKSPPQNDERLTMVSEEAPPRFKGKLSKSARDVMFRIANAGRKQMRYRQSSRLVQNIKLWFYRYWWKLTRKSRLSQPRAIEWPGKLLADMLKGDKESLSKWDRVIYNWVLPTSPQSTFDPNIVINYRYTILTFLPITIIHQFQYFFNMFYLLVGMSQLIPQLQIGPLFTYLAPLAFVISMTLIKEAVDDIKRHKRDRVINNQEFEIVTPLPSPQFVECMGEGDHYVSAKRGNALPSFDSLKYISQPSGISRASPVSQDSDVPTVSRKSVNRHTTITSTIDVLTTTHMQTAKIAASDIQVGHVLRLQANERVPCDCVFLRSLAGGKGDASDSGGSTFLRTDQLDGETDWKLRKAVNCTQQTALHELFNLNIQVEVEAPRKDIYDFAGRVLIHAKSEDLEKAEGGNSSPIFAREPLSLENTLWMNTVVTSGPILALAIFTGRETRASMHSSKPRTKMAISDLQINELSKLLLGLLFVVAGLMTFVRPFRSLTLIYFIRFVLILSSIIPISLRINLDMAKTFYSYKMSTDTKLPGLVVRNSDIPEELGAIDVLFTDKTGTITMNNMTFQKLGVGGRILSANLSKSTKDELMIGFNSMFFVTRNTNLSTKELRAYSHARVILALALCHSVTPSYDENTGARTLQAASPDEMALVSYAASLGVCLYRRTRSTITLSFEGLPRQETETETHTGDEPILKDFEVLETFPFSSATKRMGIIIRETNQAGVSKISFLLKGAESAVIPVLSASSSLQWLRDECDEFARQGLRILVFGQKYLTESEYAIFRQEYNEAVSSLVDRETLIRRVIEKRLEGNLELLGFSGVEDNLQKDVAETVEILAQAGVRVWMLTGDKVETALCIAASAGLKGRNDQIMTLISDDYPTPELIGDSLLKVAQHFFRGSSAAAITFGDNKRHHADEQTLRTPQQRVLQFTSPYIHQLILCVDGQVLAHCLSSPTLGEWFVKIACRVRSVICCRCSPTQKAEIVALVARHHSNLRLAAVGDGGNDVPMIQAAHCGIGIFGQEGMQAALASDFAITEFRHLKRLILWHGRLSYLRSAKLSHFVIHRGLVIAVIQVIIACVFFFTPIALFQGWLQIGYSTYYTMMPVFAIVWDIDVVERVLFLFPELYMSLKSQNLLSVKAFLQNLFASIYQGGAIMVCSLILFEKQLTSFVAVTFTSLVLSEWLNVATEVTKCYNMMILAEAFSVIIYLISFVTLHEYFDPNFVWTTDFWWKVLIMTSASWLPVHSYKIVKTLIYPPQYTKLMDT